MAQRHEEIVRNVMMQWTREQRGRLFKNENGKAWRGRITEESMVDGRKTLEIFGAVMIKYGLFPGSSDLIGWESILYKDKTFPVFCAIEVKTRAYGRVSEEQRNWLDAVARMGGRAYVAMEAENEAGYELKEWGI